MFQKTIRARGRVLYDYCEERNFTNRAGKQWWRGTVHQNGSGSYVNQVAACLKKVRRMAVLGQLPDEYNQKILAITGDTPVSVKAKWKRKVQPDATPTAVPSEADIDSWNADQLRAWIRSRENLPALDEGRVSKPGGQLK